MSNEPNRLDVTGTSMPVHVSSQVHKNYFGVEVSEDIVSSLQEGFVFIVDRDHASRCIRDGRVLVNDVAVSIEDLIVHPGDVITVLTPQALEPSVATDITVVYEDEQVLVVNKPAPLPCHPAGKYHFNTLLKMLEQERGLLHLVHRLDKETSGILVVAKDHTLASRLGKELIRGRVHKIYVAVVYGQVHESGVIDVPLKQVEYKDIRHHIVAAEEGDESGLNASTTFEVLVSHKDFSVLKVIPKTGRKHQIRAHLAHIGHPIVGDKQYALPESFNQTVKGYVTQEDKELLLSDRQLLHAYMIRFEKLIFGREFRYKAAMPDDIIQFIHDRLGVDIVNDTKISKLLTDE